MHALYRERVSRGRKVEAMLIWNDDSRRMVCIVCDIEGRENPASTRVGWFFVSRYTMRALTLFARAHAGCKRGEP
jgi:hypothetical protein